MTREELIEAILQEIMFNGHDLSTKEGMAYLDTPEGRAAWEKHREGKREQEKPKPGQAYQDDAYFRRKERDSDERIKERNWRKR